VTVGTEHHGRARLDEELWLADEEPEGVADRAPDGDADEGDDGKRDEVRRFGIRELLLAVCLFVPQLAWMGFLAYIAFRALS
jgi:hypothetical protein